MKHDRSGQTNKRTKASANAKQRHKHQLRDYEAISRIQKTKR